MNNARIFKVDRIYLRNFFVANYNIPVTRLNVASIEIVRESILNDFGPYTNDISYSHSANYVLCHRETGDEKFLCGSFDTHGWQYSQLARLRIFELYQFTQHVLDRTSPVIVDYQLRRVARQTAWEFTELVSVVVSVQAPLLPTRNDALPARSLFA